MSSQGVKVLQSSELLCALPVKRRGAGVSSCNYTAGGDRIDLVSPHSCGLCWIFFRILEPNPGPGFTVDFPCVISEDKELETGVLPKS